MPDCLQPPVRHALSLRDGVCALVAALFLIGLVVVPVHAQDDPIPLWNEVDGMTSGVEYRLAEPEKHPENPILRPTRPWEGPAAYLFGTVRYDSTAQRYEMWYQTYDPEQPEGRRTFVCYAVSDDGISWTKPSLGQVAYNGSTDNNIVLAPVGDGDVYGPTVVYDSTAPPSRRYTMIYSDWSTQSQGSILHAAWSSDGTNWRKYWRNPLPPISSDAPSLLPERVNGELVLFTKSNPDAARNRKRGLARARSLERWDVESRSLMVPGDFGAVEVEPYWMTASRLTERAFGLVGAYDTRNGRIAPVFTYSSPSLSDWTLPTPETAAIPLGPPGAFDHAMIFTQSDVFLPVGDEIWTYYGGWNRGHEARRRSAAIGIARWPKERFLGLRAPAEGGQVEVHDVNIDAPYLTLSADVETAGVVGVGLTDSLGQPIDGFSLSESDAITRSGDDVLLSWNGSSDLSSLRGQTVRLRIYVENASVYAYRQATSIDSQYRPKGGARLAFDDQLQVVYPNPAQDRITVEFELAESRSVHLSVYDLMGRKVKRVQQTRLSAGLYETEVSLENLASGTYLIRLQAGPLVEHRTFSVVR